MQSRFFLPEDIMVEILLRLPVRSIGRCRCVSKPWRALLSQPQFFKSHLDRVRELQQQSLILILESLYAVSLTLRNAHHLFDAITEPPRKLSFLGHRDDVIASLDGLVYVRDDSENRGFLVNPVTREIKEVLPSPFVLDPFSRYSIYGFGYDSIHDDYKIVTLSYYHPDPYSTELLANVYSVKNGSWKNVETSPYDHLVNWATPGVFIDGYIHWLACGTISYSAVIVAFDLAEEKFNEVPPPRSFQKFMFDSLVNLGGYLCMSISDCINGTEVWVMNEFGFKDSWTNFTMIDSKEVVYWPLCMFGQEQVVLLKSEGTSDEKLKYSLKEGTYKYIVVYGISDDFCVGVTFIETLVSPYCCNETR